MNPNPSRFARPRPWMPVTAVRQSLIYRPLAILLSILLAPAISWFGSGSSASPMKASAQVTSGPACAIPNCILPVPPGPIAADLLQLEQDSVKAYLEMRNLPQSEASTIYQLGRQDLRNQVRATMFTLLAGIISKPASQRSAHEQRLHDWLRDIVQANEVKMYQMAVDHYNLFLSDLCRFRLDSQLADAFGLKFNAAEYCFSSRTLSSVFMPPVPTAKYFLAYGLKYSYGVRALDTPEYTAIFQDSALTASEIWNIGLASASLAGVLGAAIIGGAISAAVTALGIATSAAISSGVAVGGIVGTAEAGFVLSAGVASSASGVALAVAGPVAIVFIAVLTGVIAGVTLSQDVDNRKELDALTGILNQVRTSTVDLTAMGTSAGGSYKLQNSFYSQTLPDTPSTAPLPQHQTTDLNFLVQYPATGRATTTEALQYHDWDNNVWTIQTVGGWFVRTCTKPVATNSCPVKDSITASIRFLDHSGAKWTAFRKDGLYIVTHGNPEKGYRDCGRMVRNTRNCRSYTSDEIPVLDGDRTAAWAGLTRLSKPSFNDPGPLDFSVGTAATRTFTASGYPQPVISLVSSPTIFTYPDAPSAPSFRLVHSNGLFQPIGRYTVTLKATNDIGSVTKDFVVTIANTLNIVSPQTVSGVAGRPFSFTVVATGLPTPQLRLDPTGYEMGGLTFQDNGNGTGTLSGIFNGRFGQQQCISGNCGGFIATNLFGTVKQNFILNMEFGAQAKLGTPQSAVFYPGVRTSTVLSSYGAETPVSWEYQGDPNATWLAFQDNGDGTATLSGTPPYHIAGLSYSPYVAPKAVGGGLAVQQALPVLVSDKPLISPPGPATFTVGTAGAFGLFTNLGTLRLTNTLPDGLSFVSGNIPSCLNCQASIQGTPPPGSGGRYTARVNSSVPAGTTTLELPIDVHEAPAFTGPSLMVMFAGRQGFFDVITSGYPNVGTRLVDANAGAPASPPDGTGPLFTVTGLPASLKASNFLSTGMRTGTLTVSGLPTTADIGTRRLQITMQNGVGAPAQQTVTLQVVPYNPTQAVSLVSTWSLARDANNNIVASIALANNGYRDLENITVTGAKIGTVTGTVAPTQIASIPAGTAASVRVLFPAASVGRSGAAGVFSVSGTHSAGSFNAAGRIVLP